MVTGRGCEFDRLAGAGEIVGALAVDLDGREGRRALHDRAGEARQSAARLRPRSGRTSEVATTSPSASSVVVAVPQSMVKR